MVGVGSRDEPLELAGASHFLEHLLFKGTVRRASRAINRAVDAVGGDFNAYTVRESTVFYVRVPAEHAAFATELLCEVIAEPLLSPDDVEIERGVILGELDGALDSPDDVVFMNLAAAMFDGHPLGRETLGDPDSLERMTPAEIEGFHRRWYRPANLTFAAAGGVDHDLVAEIVDRRWRVGGDDESPSRDAPVEMATAELHEARPIEQTHLAIGWRGLTVGDADRFALAVVNHALGDGPTSRLHEEVRERRGLAYAVASSASGHVDSGSQTVYCATAPEHLVEVRAVVDDTVASLVSDGVDDEELDVAKGYLIGSTLLSLEDPSSRMSRLGSAISTHGHPLRVADTLAAIDAVDGDAVRRVARRVFDAPSVTSLVGPG